MKKIDKIQVRITVLVAFLFTGLGLFIAGAVTIGFCALLFRLLGVRPLIALLGITLLISTVLFLLSELAVVLGYRGRIAGESTHPRLYKAVRNIKKRRKMWLRMLILPRLYVFNGVSGPNAFAFGCGLFYQRGIGITQELYDLLDDEELEAVIGHEIAHLRCGDIGLMTLITLQSGVLAYARKIIVSGKTLLGKNMFVFLLGIFLLTIEKCIFAFIRSAIQQEREIAADALGSLYVGSPEPLIRALRKLNKQHRFRKAETTIIADLLLSHPKMEERIESLKQLTKKNRKKL